MQRASRRHERASKIPVHAEEGVARLEARLHTGYNATMLCI